MNWYKKAQQKLFFYPYDKDPQNQVIKTKPIGVDPESGQNIYKCFMCGNKILENDIEIWAKDPESKEREKLQLPKYDSNRIYQAFIEISSYLKPFYDKLQKDISEGNMNLRNWEVQVPLLSNILSKYPELGDMCSFGGMLSHWNYGNPVCKLIKNNKMEFNGTDLNILFKNLILNPKEEADYLLDNDSGKDSYSLTKFQIPFLYPICEECLENMDSCVWCNNIILPDQYKYETTWDSHEFGCEKCRDNGRFETCNECGKADDTDNMHCSENDGYCLCDSCYENTSGEHIDWAKEQIASLNIPIGKNIPLSLKVINNLYQFINLYYKKYNDNKLTENEWSKIFYTAEKMKLAQEGIEYLQMEKMTGENYSISDLLGKITNNIEAQKYMSEKYPNIKSYRDIPYKIDVVDNYNKSLAGFTITITPDQSFFVYAIAKYPKIEEIWKLMKSTPHHNGVLAYARCAYDGNKNIVINNLQRDADFDNWLSKMPLYKREDKEYVEAARWLDNATRYWNIFLIDIIKAISINSNLNAYLTTFDQQKDKWSNLPIHKSKKTYQEVPESMGFNLVDPSTNVSGLIEDAGRTKRDSLYQIANLKRNWFKIAKNIRPIEIYSYTESNWELKILFRGNGPYIYQDVSPFIFDRIRILLGHKNYKEVQKMLYNLSRKNKKDSTDYYTKEEQDDMLNQLQEGGLLT